MNVQRKGAELVSAILRGAVREAVAIFDTIRVEIDPLAADAALTDGVFESEVESLEIPAG